MSALKNNNAFTLIEFVVSVLILTVGLLGLLQTINTAISNNMGNTLRNEATVVADEQLSSRSSIVDFEFNRIYFGKHQFEGEQEDT